MVPGRAVKTQIAGLPFLRSGFSTSGAEPEISNRFPGMLVLSSTEHDLVHPAWFSLRILKLREVSKLPRVTQHVNGRVRMSDSKPWF